jgi:hypothetical protein
MKRYFTFFILIIAAVAVFSVSGTMAQGRSWKNVDHGRFNVPVGRWQGNRGRGEDRGWDNGRHRYRGRNRITYGYRNYGQYRRTQVGNRRYHWIRRHRWENGRRVSRLIRIYE